MLADTLRWAVEHDPCRPDDRDPLGAVTCGTKVRIVLRVLDADVLPDAPYGSGAGCGNPRIEAVDLIVADPASEAWRNTPMARCSAGFEVFLETSGEPRVIFYRFRLQLEGGMELLYDSRLDGRATSGELGGADEREPGFQLTVYDGSLRTPDWFSGSVMYQVFPDRFARGDDKTVAAGVDYHRSMGRPVRLHGSWDDPVDWQGRSAREASDFFGGSLAGIEGKIPYLASLGVEVLYLNPVFEASSNHRYDTADYTRIDPLLGDTTSFEHLATTAKEYGISILLDAVLSHTGSDSVYFDLRGTYRERGAQTGLGAAQGEASPFHGWYDFEHPSGDAPYRCWWGCPSLPEVDEHDLTWQRFILGDTVEAPAEHARGILPSWIGHGARGYRLDVADELPDDVLELIRRSVKGADPDAVVLGEVWEDATTKISYGSRRTYALGRSLDSVMNYPLRDALIGFALGRDDAYRLSCFLRMQRLDYPAPIYASLMNLISSHDVERIRTVLSLGREVRGLVRAEQAKLRVSTTQDSFGARLQSLVMVLQFMLPGVPCTYYGDECGMQGGADPFDRATFPEDAEARATREDCGQDLTGLVSWLGNFRKRSQTLRKGSVAIFSPDEDVICVLRVATSSSEGLRAQTVPASDVCVLAAVNRSDERRDVMVDLFEPGAGLDAGAMEDLVGQKITRAMPIFPTEGPDGEAAGAPWADVFRGNRPVGGNIPVNKGLVRIELAARSALILSLN